MKKLFLLSVLFSCPWLVQAAEVKREFEQKPVARHGLLAGVDLGRLHKESRARREVECKQVAQIESVQDLPVPVVAASSAARESQAVPVANSDEERAKLRMAEINRKHKVDTEALLQRIADGQVVPRAPRPAEELAGADVVRPLTWKEKGALFLYLAVPIAVLAFGNGVVNNISARYAGLGLKRWRSYRAPWWEFVSGTVFRALQVGWAESFFYSIGLYDERVETSYRWEFRLGAYGVLQPIIGIFHELAETMPLGKFGPGWRSTADYTGEHFFDERFYQANLSLQITALLSRTLLRF